MKLLAAVTIVVFLASKAVAAEVEADQDPDLVIESVEVPRSRILGRIRRSVKASRLEFIRGYYKYKCVGYEGTAPQSGDKIEPTKCYGAPYWKYRTDNHVVLYRSGTQYCIEADYSDKEATLQRCRRTSKQRWWFVRRIVRGDATYAMYNERYNLFLELTDDRKHFKLDDDFPDDEQDIIKIENGFFKYS